MLVFNATLNSFQQALPTGFKVIDIGSTKTNKAE